MLHPPEEAPWDPERLVAGTGTENPTLCRHWKQQSLLRGTSHSLWPHTPDTSSTPLSRWINPTHWQKRHPEPLGRALWNSVQRHPFSRRRLARQHPATASETWSGRATLIWRSPDSRQENELAQGSWYWRPPGRSVQVRQWPAPGEAHKPVHSLLVERRSARWPSWCSDRVPV